MRVGHQSRVKPSGQGREPVERRQTAGGDVGGGGGEGTLGDFIGKLGMPSCFTESSVDLTSNCMLERR